MSTNHTQGPWSLHGGITLVGDPYSKTGQHALYCADIRHPGFVGSVCTIQSADHVDTGITREMAEANARLIAAAPELLEALQALNHSLDRGELQHDDQRAAFDAARAAIAKALGERA